MLPIKTETNNYIRYEKNNYITVHSDEYGLKLLNPTAAFIYENCNGNNNLIDLQNLMCSKYPNIDRKVIDEDVKETIYYLRDLELLSFDNEDNDEGTVYRIASDYDFTNIRMFILNHIKEKSNCTVYLPTNNTSYYLEYQLRSRQFSLQELNYICVNSSDISQLITIQNIDKMTGTVIVSQLVGNLDSEGFKGFYNYVISDLKRFNVNKLRIQIVDDPKLDFNINFDSIGFFLESNLKREYNNRDLKVYSKFIQ